MRAKCHFEDIDKGRASGDHRRRNPVSGEQEERCLNAWPNWSMRKKLEGISHIQDESDKDGHARGDRTQAR